MCESNFMFYWFHSKVGVEGKLSPVFAKKKLPAVVMCSIIYFLVLQSLIL